jgi:hypothetical protein
LKYSVVKKFLYFTGENSNISNNSSYSAFAGTGVLVCGQRITGNYCNLFKEDYYV